MTCRTSAYFQLQPTIVAGKQSKDQEPSFLTHNLKTSPQSMNGWTWYSQHPGALGPESINQFYRHQCLWCSPNISGYLGAYWYGLTSTKINVFRAAQDNSAGRVRVRIWSTANPILVLSGRERRSVWGTGPLFR